MKLDMMFALIYAHLTLLLFLVAYIFEVRTREKNLRAFINHLENMLAIRDNKEGK